MGRRMPLTMTAFTLGALGMIGVPPLAGFISKWYLGWGALAVGEPWVLAVLVISGLLNAAYFLPMIYRGWFASVKEGTTERTEAPPMLLWPALFTAALALLVGVFAAYELSPLAWAQLIVNREFDL